MAEGMRHHAHAVRPRASVATAPSGASPRAWGMHLHKGAVHWAACDRLHTVLPRRLGPLPPCCSWLARRRVDPAAAAKTASPACRTQAAAALGPHHSHSLPDGLLSTPQELRLGPPQTEQRARALAGPGRSPADSRGALQALGMADDARAEPSGLEGVQGAKPCAPACPQVPFAALGCSRTLPALASDARLHAAALRRGVDRVCVAALGVAGAAARPSGRSSGDERQRPGPAVPAVPGGWGGRRQTEEACAWLGGGVTLCAARLRSCPLFLLRFRRRHERVHASCLSLPLGRPSLPLVPDHGAGAGDPQSWRRDGGRLPVCPRMRHGKGRVSVVAGAAPPTKRQLGQREQRQWCRGGGPCC